MDKLLLGCLLFFALPSKAGADPNKLEYELRERCGKRASEEFYRENPKRSYNDKDGFHTHYYQAHYDPVSNRCFYLSGMKSVNGREQEMSVVEVLHDTDENREIGSFIQIMKSPPAKETWDCRVGRKRCSSEDEWRELIKPMMGDTD
jgi:hypothetical protein